MFNTNIRYFWTGAIIFTFMCYQLAAYNGLAKKIEAEDFLNLFLLPGLMTAVFERNNG